jgi:hypothetical protein
MFRVVSKSGEFIAQAISFSRAAEIARRYEGLIVPVQVPQYQPE